MTATKRVAATETARLGARIMHAKHDPHETTAKARDTFLSRFERQADPDGTLPEWQRAIRATAARKLYFAELAYRRWYGTTPNDTSTPRQRRYPCKRCLMEQGLPLTLSSNGRICKRHASLWRIRALRWLVEHGGEAQQTTRQAQQTVQALQASA